MSETRKLILERIRANRQAETTKADATKVEAWLQQHARGPRPQWQKTLLDQFADKLQQSGATYGLTTMNQLISKIAQFRREHDLDGSLVCAQTPALRTLDWPDEIPVKYRAALAEDQMALTEAFCAVAETGSLVLRSGMETPSTLNFLPEYFVCVLHPVKIVNWLEDVWTLLRREGGMPRAINFVTGPSRTADVEQTIQMGAHGPRHVHVLLITDHEN